MEVPGLSLFQGAESIKLNTEQQRVEEEDAIEDRKRRNEELKHELENAFDDLDDDFDDDDDVSVSYNASNSSVNCKNTAALPNAIFNGLDTNHKAHIDNRETDLMNEVMKLKNVLASKTEELRNITAEFNNERVILQNKIDELNKRLAITEAEKERAYMNRQQTHELFVESKQKLSELDEQISELKAKNKSLDARNLELLAELERTKSLLSDVQHKYHMVERNVSYSSDKHTDSIIKQLNDQHAAKTDMMKQQINIMRTKLEDRESELKRLLVQNNELQNSREAMLLDKSDTINQLSKRLDESQRQVQELILKNGSVDDLTQENVNLMRSVNNLQQQTKEMQQTIIELTSRLELTTTELEQLTETAIQDVETICPYEDHNQLTNCIVESPMIRKSVSYPKLAVSSTPLMVEDRITRLKKEFNRCMIDQKAKRQEILALKEELAIKNREIDRLKADENHLLIQLSTSKENAERLEIRLKNMEREFEEFKNKTQSDHLEPPPKEENEFLNHLHKLQTNCDHLNETIRALEDERDRTEEKYKGACKDLAELQHKIGQLESNPCLQCEKEKFLTNDANQECIRLKELYLRISEEKEDALRKLRQIESNDLNKELLEQRNMVASLKQSLQLAEMRCTEISKILEGKKIEYETQIQNLRTKYEQEISDITSKEQKDTTNSCRKCIDMVSKIAKFEIENFQLQSTCSGYTKDIYDLKKSLKKAEQTITDLTEKLAFKLEHDQMLDELKNKAKLFEQFMRNQSPTKSILVDAIISSSQTNRVRDQCVSTEDLVESPQSISQNSTILERSAEKKIRLEMSRTMAVKVKALENEYLDKLLEHTKQINDLHTTLKERETDITNLKTCILKERYEVKNILEQKDFEHSESIKKLQNMLVATRCELDGAKKRVDTLLNELEQCRIQFQTERESTNKLLVEWKAELTALVEREENLTEQIRFMESSHKATVESLNEKYVAAKRTAANYKMYSTEKERHIERESERIKLAYETALEKLRESTRIAIKETEKEARKRVAEIQVQLNALIQNRNCATDNLIN